MGVHVWSCCSSDLNSALALKLMHGHVAGEEKQSGRQLPSGTEPQDGSILLRARLNVSVVSALTRRFRAKRAEHLYEARTHVCVFVCVGQA